MKPDLVLREAAAEDIVDAERWYEAQAPGLGARFASAIERTLALIESNPVAYQIVDDPIRRAVVRKFPTTCSTCSRRTMSWCSPCSIKR